MGKRPIVMSPTVIVSGDEGALEIEWPNELGSHFFSTTFRVLSDDHIVMFRQLAESLTREGYNVRLWRRNAERII
jgi:hypothetical protein